MSDVLNPRRAPRLPVRYTVQVRHRFSSWSAQTEDLGPGGCQLVTPRLVEPGREVVLEIEVPGRRVRAQGTVVWTRAEAPSRLGVSFAPSSIDRGWFQALLAADAVAAGAVRRQPERLSARARVYLGEPPRYLVDFAPEELLLLRRIGSGVTVEVLVRSFGPSPQRAVGALFALVARRQVVLDPARSPGPNAWRATFERAEIAAAAESLGEEPPVTGPWRLPAVQKLYAEALDHLAAGRIGLAVARLQDAHQAAPEDQAIKEDLERLRPWA